MTKSIAQKAESILREHSLFSAPVDVDGLAAKLGIHVIYEPLDDGYSAFLLVKNGIPSAFVNSEHHPNRRRFSLAHEIGHFVLHHQVGVKDRIFLDRNLSLYTRKDINSPRSSNLEMEKEANIFAAELLMPQSLIKMHIARHELDITDEFDVSRLAVAFGVSEQALQIRLSVLHLAVPNF